MSDSLQSHELQPTRLLRPWDSLGKNTGWVPISFSRRKYYLLLGTSLKVLNPIQSHEGLEFQQINFEGM